MTERSSPIRVLHVDDDPDFADLTAEFLEREDDRIAVKTASTASDGLEQLAEHEFDCVVSDYDMPGQNGLDFLEAVREDHPELAFILYTGKGSEEVASDAISAGVTDYLQKEAGTSQYEILLNRIENAVSKHRAEQEVVELLRRYETVSEVASDAFWEWDLETDTVHRSEGFQRVFGYDEDEIAADLEWHVERVHPNDRDGVFDVANAAMEAGEKSFQDEHRFRKADGTYAHLIVRGRIFYHEAGEPTRILGALTDITDRREKTRRLETLISNLPGIVYRCRNEPDWPMEFVRGDCESLTGYSAEALEEGRVIWGEDVLHPADQEEMWTAVQAALAEDRPFEVTYRIQTKAGATKWMWERGQLVESEVVNGQVLEGFITDITDQREHERALARSRNRYETVFKSTEDAIAWVEFEGETPIIRETNPAFEELFAPPDTDITGMDLDELVASGDRFEEAREITRQVKEGESIEGELTRETVEGPRDFRWRAVPIEDPETGEINSGYAVYTDVTERKESEQELQKARSRMEFALDATDAIVWSWNIEADETVFYPSAETLYGTAVDSWEDFIEVVHPEDRQKVNDSIERALETGDLKQEEIRIVRDGEIRWIDAPGQPVLDDDGPDRMLGVARDITERKRREQQLREEQAFNQLALDSIIEFYWRIDPDGFVTDWSDTDGSVTGYATEEAIGMHATEFFPEREHDYIEERIGKLLETGSVTAEADFRKKDGTLVPYRFDGTVLTDDDGEVETLCGFGQDISERVERERKLQEERDYNAQLIERIPDIFYVAGTDGTLREWNERIHEVTGYSAEELDGMQALEFFAKEDRERISQAIEETLTTGQASVEADVITADGDRIPYEFTGGRLTDTDGELIGLVGIGRDISDRLERERRLQRERDRLEEFAGVLSHDLRNPLNVAQGRLGLAQQEFESDNLDTVAQSLGRMEELINDVLSLARAGDAIGETTAVDLSELATACWRNVETERAELVIESEASVQADMTRLQQLLENLLRNAVEHGGGDVTITIGDLPGGFYIEDDGPGIPEDQRDSVLDPGYSTSESGTGFGLSIVRDIADAHDWAINVTEGSAGGARFEFRAT